VVDGRCAGRERVHWGLMDRSLTVAAPVHQPTGASRSSSSDRSLTVAAPVHEPTGASRSSSSDRSLTVAAPVDVVDPLAGPAGVERRFFELPVPAYEAPLDDAGRPGRMAAEVPSGETFVTIGARITNAAWREVTEDGPIGGSRRIEPQGPRVRSTRAPRRRTRPWISRSVSALRTSPALSPVAATT